MVDEDKSDIDIKIVILGVSEVGKTCLLLKYFEDKFYESSLSSIGIDYKTKFFKFEGLKVKANYVDTAGQERFRAMSKIFYADAEIAILVYDITREDSFQEIKNYWMNEIKENASKDIIVGIVANKCDLIEDEQVNENDARQFAKNYHAEFFPTSAKNKDGINELFTEMGTIYLNKLGGGNENATKGNNKSKKKLKPLKIKTTVYPGFPTDLGQPMSTFLTQCDGESQFEETIYENRMRHIPHLNNMGADILAFDKNAVIKGKTQLKGRKVKATDLRAGASVMVAGLIATGKTEISNIEHLLRGYERIVDKLNNVGANIKLVDE